MGRLKQLLPWNGSTILETVVDNVAGCCYIDDEIRVVVGAEAERIIPVLESREDPRLIIRENRNFREGMLTSVWTGLRGLPSSTNAVMFILGDQPLIGPEVFNRMAENYLKYRAEITVPLFKGKRGHPVIIDTVLLPEVKKLTGPGGLRSLLWKYPEKIRHVEMNKPEITIDLDYFYEYEEYKKLYGQE